MFGISSTMHGYLGIVSAKFGKKRLSLSIYLYIYIYQSQNLKVAKADFAEVTGAGVCHRIPEIYLKTESSNK